MLSAHDARHRTSEGRRYEGVRQRLLRISKASGRRCAKTRRSHCHTARPRRWLARFIALGRLGTRLSSAYVTVCDVRSCEGLRMPATMMVARRTLGPAYANLQWRKPRDVGRGGASDAMGISALAVCCRGAMTACLGSGQWSGELGRPIAMGRTGAARRRLIDEAVVRGGAAASMVIAGRGPAQQKCCTGMSPRT
jgi:hypothetical protein